MKKNRLLLNTLTGVLDIVNCFLFAISWFVIIGDAFSNSKSLGSDGAFFYIMAWIGVVVNIVALVQSKRHKISLVGSVLGIIGSALFGFTSAMAFPAIVVLIIAAIFIMLQHPAKNDNTQKVEHNHPTNIQEQTTLSSSDELIKLKKLLDENVITQEEFEAKKKQLLNL